MLAEPVFVTDTGIGSGQIQIGVQQQVTAELVKLYREGMDVLVVTHGSRVAVQCSGKTRWASGLQRWDGKR